MRSKEEIVNELKRTKQDNISTYYAGTPSEMITLEVLIDIRDLISSLTTILGSVEKIAYRAG
jgi:hypothetical protein